MSNERPILFSGPMVPGTKTQTRRLDGLEVINRKPDAWRYDGPCGYVAGNTPQYWEWFDNTETGDDVRLKCPYWPGQRRWVRETWAPDPLIKPAVYKADTYPVTVPVDGRWRPSIHMPRWASRLTLEIVSVRVERVQDISEQDAMAEGVKGAIVSADTGERAGFVTDFAYLWDSINAPRGYGWHVNPWVWAVDFRRVQE